MILFFFFFPQSHRQPGSNQSQNKSAEITHPRSTFLFLTNVKRKLRKPFVQVTRLLRNGFMLTYSTVEQDILNVQVPFIPHFHKTRWVHVSRSYASTYTPFRQSGWDTRPGFYRAIEIFWEQNAESNSRGAVTQHRVYRFISLNASCNLRLRWCQNILQEKEVTHGRKLWTKFAISVTNYLTLTVVNGVWVPFNLHTIKAYLTATNSHWKSITTSPLGVRYRRDSQPCCPLPQCLEQTNSRHFKGKGLFKTKL